MKDNMKICTKCLTEKSLDDFYRDVQKRDGKSSACKACIKTSQNDAYAHSPNKFKARVNQRYQANKAEICQQRNSDPRVKASSKKYREANPDKVRAWSRAWAKKNPEKRNAWHKVAMSRRRASSGSHTVPEWNTLLEKCNHQCVCCGAQPAMLERDHIVPVIQGGSDYISNIQPLCGTCNKRKGIQTMNFLHER